MTTDVLFKAGDPAPFNDKAADSLDYCFSCGRKLGSNPWFFEVNQGWMLIDPSAKNSDSQGCFPVGVECAKKFNPELLVKLGLS